MRTTNARAFVVPAVAALVLSACFIGASRPAEAQFMMPVTHMPLARGPITHGPATNGVGIRGAVPGPRVNPPGVGVGTVRIPPSYHPKLHGHPINTDTVTNDCGRDGRRYRRDHCGTTRHHGGVGIVDLPVNTDGGGGAVQQGGGAGSGGAGNGVARGAQDFVPDEVITEFRPNASPQAIAQLARRFNLTQLESQRFDLIGGTFYRWRIGGRRAVPAVTNALANQSIVAAVQPNHVFVLQDEMASSAAATHGDPAQYVASSRSSRRTSWQPAKAFCWPSSTRRSTAVTRIWLARSPKISMRWAAKAIRSCTAPKWPAPSLRMASCWASRLVLAARAFDNTPGKARGTSFDIFKSLQWAADNGARVINMSFAGPADPTLHRMLAAAYAKDIVLIAAAGNNGPNATPAYPGADPDVIAVTATDADDQPFKLANHGKYVAVAAPGVEILAVAPDASYQTTTGTSVAAAHVSGIAALLLQRDSELKPTQIRAILTATAKPLGTANQHDEFGAGLVDAYRAVMAPQIKAAGSGEAREQATR